LFQAAAQVVEVGFVLLQVQVEVQVLMQQEPLLLAEELLTR
jgi:hypothetical protein